MLQGDCAVHSNLMTQRGRLSPSVDIACAQCGKPMMMLSFNYTTLERSFESISLRCQYCKAEETRPWPRAEQDEGSDQQAKLGDADDQSQSSSQVVNVDTLQPVGRDDTRSLDSDMPLPDQETDSASVNTVLNVESGLPSDAPSSSPNPNTSSDDYERLRARFAGRSGLPPDAPET